MKLYYFNMKGRAETPRLVMNLGGKKFEDVRFSGEEWGAKYKAMSPSGQVRRCACGTKSQRSRQFARSLVRVAPSKPYELQERTSACA